MNKADLIAKIAKDTGYTKVASEEIINSCISNIKGALKKGQCVTLVGFGTWCVAKRKARNGRNPQTGRTMRIPAKKVPKFRPGKALKDAV